LIARNVVKIKAESLHVQTLTDDLAFGRTFDPLEVGMVTFVRKLLTTKVVLTRLHGKVHSERFLGIGRPLLSLVRELLRSKEKRLVNLGTIRSYVYLEEYTTYSKF
jgi:hypothetical protein